MSEPGWEYRLYADVLQDGLENLRNKRNDHDVEHATTVRVLPTERQALDYFIQRASECDRIMHALPTLLSPQNLTRMFGEPGKPGDADRIRHGGARFVETYERLLDWAADMRGTATPASCTALYAAGARLVTAPLRQIEGFVRQFREAAQGNHSVALFLTIDYDLSEVRPLLTALSLGGAPTHA